MTQVYTAAPVISHDTHDGEYQEKRGVALDELEYGSHKLIIIELNGSDYCFDREVHCISLVVCGPGSISITDKVDVDNLILINHATLRSFYSDESIFDLIIKGDPHYINETLSYWSRRGYRTDHITLINLSTQGSTIVLDNQGRDDLPEQCTIYPPLYVDTLTLKNIEVGLGSCGVYDYIGNLIYI